MKQLRKALGHSEKGFTLLELLVVVAILGVLAAIVTPNVLTFMSEGEEEARQAEHHNLQTAVLALLTVTDQHTLEANYEGVQERDAVENVKAIAVDGTEYTLDNYLIGGQYPLLQSYDISKGGSVSVHPG